MGYSGRVRISRLWSSHEEFIDQEIKVGGWSKSVRGQKEMSFVTINDGSCFKNLQVIIEKGATGFDDVSKSIVGASYIFKGKLIKSPAKG